MTKTAADTNVGLVLSDLLRKRDLSQAGLGRMTGTQPAYVNQQMTGRRTPGAEWIELVANTLKLAKTERQKLHVAAAVDNGFKIDLT